jgi:hypothetical protein
VSYPQPNADQYSISGAQYFRLNTLISSPGDIYESAQGGLAFALGPESDISRVNVAYFDDQAGATLMNQTQIDCHRSWVGRIDARNDAAYQQSGRPGRILMWSDDLYDPIFVPTGSAGQTVIRIAPRLDVIEYFREEPSLVTRRTDKQYYFQSYALSGQPTWIVIPSYGRKYGFVEITNRDPLIALGFKVIGVNYGIGSAFHQETTIYSGVLAVGAQKIVNNLFGSSGTGMFDSIVVTAEGDRMPMRVYLSDET